MMKSVRSKILASILLTTVIVAFGITAVIYKGAVRMVEENYITVFGQRQEQTMNVIDQLTRELSYISIDAACDTELKQEIMEYGNTKEEQLLEQISEKARTFSKRNDEISSVYLLLPKERTVITSREYPVYRRDMPEELTDWLEKRSEQCRPWVIRDFVYDEEPILTFPEKVYDDNGQVIGYFFVNIESRKLYYDYLDVLADSHVKEAVLLREDQVIASLDMEMAGMEYRTPDQNENWIQGQEKIGSDSENIYIYSKGDYSKLGLFLRIDRKAIMGNVSDIKISLLCVMLLMLLLSLIPAFYLTRMVYRPLQELTHTIKHVSDGELEIRAEVISKDEIGSLSVEFNQMLDQIEHLIQEVIEQETQKKNAELEALQYQITPHFLYNTLNSIKCAAMLRGEKDLAKLLEDFVELLQASISKKGTFLTVAEEIHILKNYLNLQNFRYGGEFMVVYEVEDEVQQCLVPRLLLQPLVENALLHGLDIKEKNGRITIRAWRKKEKLYLEVEDNGRGMTQEQIRELLNSKAKKTRGLTAVGVSNIRERLSLYYGSEAGLSYESGESGTKALICLPAAMETGESI